MPVHSALRAFVQAYRSQGCGPLSAADAVKVVELAAQAADEVERLRVQLDVMSSEVDAHESISAELEGAAARMASQDSGENPYPIQPDITPARSMHYAWQQGWETHERMRELQMQNHMLERENALRAAQLEALGVTPARDPARDA
jgi:hypothetical protein